MKIVAQFVTDDTFIIKDPNYDIKLFTIVFTNDMVERLAEYRLDPQRIAGKMADAIESELNCAQLGRDIRETFNSNRHA